jgi:hypothetical protein
MMSAITMAGIGSKPAMSGAMFVAATATKNDSSKPGKRRRTLANPRVTCVVETVNVEAS